MSAPTPTQSVEEAARALLNAKTPDASPLPPQREALTAFAKFVDEETKGVLPIWLWLARYETSLGGNLESRTPPTPPEGAADREALPPLLPVPECDLEGTPNAGYSDEALSDEAIQRYAQDYGLACYRAALSAAPPARVETPDPELSSASIAGAFLHDVPADLTDWRAEFWLERGKFAAETMRSSKIANALLRLIQRLKDIGCDDKPWGKQCATCDLMIEARAALSEPAPSNLFTECEPYLKEGETPLQRIERDHADSLALMSLLSKEKLKAEALTDALTDALEFVEDHSDVKDGPDGEPVANRAMLLAETLRTALAGTNKPNTATVDALRELVAVKELKDRIEAAEHGSADLLEVNRWRGEYLSRKWAAWAAARAALASHPKAALSHPNTSACDKPTPPAEGEKTP